MSIEEAFSLEKEEPLTALKANSLRRQNLLRKANSFVCVGSHDCNAKLTCINFSKSPGDWVMAPHFRLLPGQSNNHSINCKYFKREVKGKKNKQPQNASLHNKGEFNLKLNSTGFKKPQPSKPIVKNNASNAAAVTTYVSRSNPNNKKTKSVNSEISSLRKLIEVYNSDDYDNSQTMITVGSKTLCLNELFINFDSSKEITMNLCSFVYFGKAIIFERKIADPYYIIRFDTENHFVSSSETIKAQASFLVFKNQIEKHRHLRVFKKHVNNKPILCYIYGNPEISKHKYINFKLENYYNILFKTCN